MISILRHLWMDGEAPTPAEYALMLMLVAAAIILGAVAAGGDAPW